VRRVVLGEERSVFRRTEVKRRVVVDDILSGILLYENERSGIGIQWGELLVD
jgi:hypothetical protein